MGVCAGIGMGAGMGLGVGVEIYMGMETDVSVRLPIFVPLLVGLFRCFCLRRVVWSAGKSAA